MTAHNDCRVPPFGHPRITARLTTPRGLSRPPTSFIGSWCQGIHRAPLITWPQMLASTVHLTTTNREKRKPSLPQDPTANQQPQKARQNKKHEPQPARTTPADTRGLLRKEVIQPHLPVRLPCYDFVPIASPTFDGSLHKGWATGFGCYRLS